MFQKNHLISLLFQRWSTTVSFLCYLVFIIWSLVVPLKSDNNVKVISGQINFDLNAGLNPNNALNPQYSPEIPKDIRIDYDKGKDPLVVLKDVFKKADTNGDGFLDTNELAKWINFKIKQHISKAIHNNYGLFTLVDVNPRNGVVTWEEYHAYFLKQKGLSSHYVNNHDEKKHVGLQRSLKEQIMRDKAYWREAARFDPSSLTVDEFLSFTHPESSASNHLAVVDELYEKFDRDGDEYLTEDEFATVPINRKDSQIEAPKFQTFTSKHFLGDSTTILLHTSELERRSEFRKSIDLNHDGKADRRELLRYIAPQNPRRSELEAQTLISLADLDHDEFLSLSEVLARPDLFMASKMVDTGKSFHDEF